VFAYTSKKELMIDEFCIDTSYRTPLILQRCHGQGASQRWLYDKKVTGNRFRLFCNEGIGNGALRWSTAILWTNDQYFMLLWSIGVYGKLSLVEHLQIYILCPCRRAPLYFNLDADTVSILHSCIRGMSVYTFSAVTYVRIYWANFIFKIL